MILPTNCFQSWDLILFGHQFRRYVEHLFHCEVFGILDGMPIVCVILSHEYRWFQCHRHEHCPYQQKMFFSIFCNIRDSFSVFFALDHSPLSRMMWILTTIPILFRRFQWWIAVALLLFDGSIQFAPFFREVLPRSPRTALFHRAGSSRERNLIGTRVSFTKKLQRVAPFHHLSQLSNSKDSNFHRFFPGLSVVEGARFEGALKIKLIIGLDFAVNLPSPDSFLCSFRHHFRTLCRTEIAVEQTPKMIPFVTCEISFGMSSSWFGVDVLDLNFWVRIDSIEKPIKRNSVGPGNIILINASLSWNTYHKTSWCEIWTFQLTRSTLFKMWNIPRDCWFDSWLVSRWTTNCPVLSWFWVVFPWTKTIRSHNSGARSPSNVNPASEEMISDSAELCENEVCSHRSNLLEQMCNFQKRTMFLQK